MSISVLLQGDFVLHIDIFNDQTYDNQPYPGSQRELILSTTIRSSIWPNASWHHSQTVDSSSNSHEFSFRYRVSCSSHFYGSQCSRFCSPLSSRSRCDPRTGDILCQQGWTGSDCNQGKLNLLSLRTFIQLDRIVLLRSSLSTWMSTWPVRESTGPMSLPCRLDRPNLSNIALHQGRTLEPVGQWEIPLRKRSLSKM